MINYTSLHFLRKYVYGRPFIMVFIIDDILKVGYVCTMLKDGKINSFQGHYTTNDTTGKVDSFMTHHAYDLETVRNIWRFLKNSDYEEVFEVTIDHSTITHATDSHTNNFFIPRLFEDFVPI